MTHGSLFARLCLKLGLVAATLAMGACAAPTDAADAADDDVEETEDGVSGACVLGTPSCGDLAVLPAKSFAAPVDSGRTRAGLTASGFVPTLLMQRTTRAFTLRENWVVGITSPAMIPLEMINVSILFEVLDAASGRPLGAAYAGRAADVRLDGRALRRIGPVADSLSPTTTELGSLTPTGTAIKLRTSVVTLDPARGGRVSPFRAEARFREPVRPCSGPSLSAADAARLASPGATSRDLPPLAFREEHRICNAANGCTEWRIEPYHDGKRLMSSGAKSRLSFNTSGGRLNTEIAFDYRYGLGDRDAGRVRCYSGGPAWPTWACSDFDAHRQTAIGGGRSSDSRFFRGMNAVVQNGCFSVEASDGETINSTTWVEFKIAGSMRF